MRSYQALEDAHNNNNNNGGRHRRFREAGAASSLLSQLSAVIDGVVSQ